MTTVQARGDESFDRLLRRFRRKVQDEKILSTVRRKRFFTPKSEERRRAQKRAMRRIRRQEAKRKRIEERYG